MHAIQSYEILTPAESFASSRTRIYSLMAESFRYPDASFRKQIINDDFKKAFTKLFGNLPYAFDWTQEELYGIQQIAVSGDLDMEVEFIRMFESGPGNPPLPLLEGLYYKERRTVFKELILFYNHFGLSYDQGALTDRPDHICYELEFLHYLTFKELLAIQETTDETPYIRAQHDFLKRHLLNWVGLLVDKMHQMENALPDAADASLSVFWFYRALIHMTWRLLNADFHYIQTRLKSPSQREP